MNREHDRHPVVERQIFRHLAGDMPEGDPRSRKQWPDERAVELANRLFVPGRHGDRLEATTWKIPLGAVGQQKHGLKSARSHGQEFLAKMQRIPAQATVDVAELFEIDDDAGQAHGRSRPLSPWGSSILSDGGGLCPARKVTALAECCRGDRALSGRSCRSGSVRSGASPDRRSPRSSARRQRQTPRYGAS